MTLHSYQLYVNDLLVEINSPWVKIVICCPLFHPASSPESFPERLSVSPSLAQIQGALNQNAGPKGYLQNHKDFNTLSQIHVFSSSANGLKCHLKEKALSWQW